MGTISPIEALLWVALNIYHEGKFQPYAGQRAIAHVTWNRAMACGESVKDTVLKQSQFSWTLNDPLLVLTSSKPGEIKKFSWFVRIAEQSKSWTDITEGSTYYHRHDISPSWAAEKEFVVRIGDHVFYREPNGAPHTDSCGRRMAPKVVKIVPAKKKEVADVVSKKKRADSMLKLRELKDRLKLKWGLIK